MSTLPLLYLAQGRLLHRRMFCRQTAYLATLSRSSIRLELIIASVSRKVFPLESHLETTGLGLTYLFTLPSSHRRLVLLTWSHSWHGLLLQLEEALDRRRRFRPVLLWLEMMWQTYARDPPRAPSHYSTLLGLVRHLSVLYRILAYEPQVLADFCYPKVSHRCSFSSYFFIPQ